MKYMNAADLLPASLLEEIQQYVGGQFLYIPSESKRQAWGEKSGSKDFCKKRNLQIKEAFKAGQSMEDLSSIYGLAYETIRKIVYKK